MNRNLVLILGNLLKITFVLAEGNPTCWMYDFNEWPTINEFRAGRAPSGVYLPLIIKHYRDTDTPPFRANANQYLSGNITNTYLSLTTIGTFDVTPSTVFEMAINYERGENGLTAVMIQEKDTSNPFTFYSIFHLNSSTNGWVQIQNVNQWKMKNVQITIQTMMSDNARLAIEYLRLFDPEITYENCVPQEERPSEPTTEIDPTTEDTTTTETDPTTEDTTNTESVEPTEVSPSPTQPPSDNPSCLVADFDHPIITDFDECAGLFLPSFIVKSYSDSMIQPHRNTSQYHLTNQWEGLSCFQSLSLFNLNENSVFSMAIFFDASSPGAWVKVHVIDKQTGDQEFVLNIDESSANWQIVTGSVRGRFSNAQIFIQTNMNSYATMGIEYLNVGNAVTCDRNGGSTTETTESAEPTQTTEVTPSPTQPPSEDHSCLLVDFNQTAIPYFDECTGLYLPKFIIKPYSDSTVRPYRSTSQYHLTNQWEGLSCMQTQSLFALNENSVLNMAIHFEGLWPGAWVKVHIIDKRTGDQEFILEIDQSQGSANWQTLSGTVTRKFTDAQIFIQTNMNSFTTMAIEYLDIGNTVGCETTTTH